MMIFVINLIWRRLSPHSRMPHRHIHKIDFIEIKPGHSAALLPMVVRRAEGTDRCVEEEDLRGRKHGGVQPWSKSQETGEKARLFTEGTKADVERCKRAAQRRAEANRFSCHMT